MTYQPKNLVEGIGYLIMRLSGMSDHDIDLNEQKERKKLLKMLSRQNKPPQAQH
nr:phage tail tube assembly chaperone [Lactiplantibacillus plantarum]